MEVAAEHAEAHRGRSRQRMEERFFLDGIKLERSNVSVRHEQPSAAIESNAADAVEPIEYHAPVAACETAQPAIFELLVQFTFPCVGLADVLECCAFRCYFFVRCLQPCRYF